MASACAFAYHDVEVQIPLVLGHLRSEIRRLEAERDKSYLPTPSINKQLGRMKDTLEGVLRVVEVLKDEQSKLDELHSREAEIHSKLGALKAETAKMVEEQNDINRRVTDGQELVKQQIMGGVPLTVNAHVQEDTATAADVSGLEFRCTQAQARLAHLHHQRGTCAADVDEIREEISRCASRMSSLSNELDRLEGERSAASLRSMTLPEQEGRAADQCPTPAERKAAALARYRELKHLQKELQSMLQQLNGDDQGTERVREELCAVDKECSIASDAYKKAEEQEIASKNVDTSDHTTNNAACGEAQGALASVEQLEVEFARVQAELALEQRQLDRLRDSVDARNDLDELIREAESDLTFAQSELSRAASLLECSRKSTENLRQHTLAVNHLQQSLEQLYARRMQIAEVVARNEVKIAAMEAEGADVVLWLGSAEKARANAVAELMDGVATIKRLDAVQLASRLAERSDQDAAVAGSSSNEGGSDGW